MKLGSRNIIVGLISLGMAGVARNGTVRCGRERYGRCGEVGLGRDRYGWVR